MANIKYQINVSEEQINNLKKALHVGSPLSTALKFAGISRSTYYYWVAIASLVRYVKEQEFAKQQSDLVDAGISFAAIKESIQEDQKETEHHQSTIDAFIEPTPESILKYKTNRSFKEFADKVYAIIEDCDRMRSEIVMYHLTAIRDSARQRGASSNASQWFLERTLPEYFGRVKTPEEIENENKKKVETVEVKFISPDNKDTTQRVRDMETLVEHQLGMETPKS